MALTLQQTDTAPGCSAAAFCSGRTLTGGTPGESQASDGGTAGITEDSLSIKNGESNVAIYSIECVIPDGYTDATGNWTVNLEVTTGTPDALITEVHICRVNSSCVSQESVASSTGLSTAVTAGTKQFTPNQASAVTWAAGDTAQIVFVVTQDAGVHGATGFGITPSATIEAPGSAAVVDTVTPDDATHSHTADSPALAQVHSLVVQEAAHGHAADSTTLAQVHDLAVQEASHTHLADNATLALTVSVSPDAATHAHAADASSLSQVHDLTVAGATHSHTADGTTLSQVHDLQTDEALHSHAADNVTLQVQGTDVVSPNDAVHGHSSDAPALSQVHDLTVQEAIHGHSADNVTLSQGLALIVASAVHAHSADVASLSQVHDLIAASASHSHTAGATTLSQTHLLAVASALHPHSADATSLSEAGAKSPPPAVRRVVADRDLSIAARKENQVVADRDLTVVAG